MAPAHFVLLAGIGYVVTAQRCLDRGGDYALQKPQPADNTYGPICQAWNKDTCCTAKYTQDLANYGPEYLYPGFTWNHCQQVKNLSASCQRFLMYEECFYSCDPYAAYFMDPENNWTVKGVPICSTYCDDWFEACADDYTCVQDWMNWPITDGAYTCPLGSTCRTYREVYGNGTGMCNKMWGKAFFASSNMDACYSMYFWGQNPNRYITGGDANGVSAAAVSAVAAVLVAISSALALHA